MHIVIDGNIGSGKTTQLNLLERAGWFVKREPLDKWPLELFYKDMSRWAFLLQIRILQTIRKEPRDITVYERCLLSTRHVFWEHLLKKKLVTDEENTAYESCYERYKWYPDVYIFLAKKPELAYEHIQTRGQVGDCGVTLEYLQDLDVLYKDMIRNVPCQVYVLNAERSPEEIHAEVVSILSLYTVKQNGRMFVSDAGRSKMQTTGTHSRKMLCTPFTNMCNLS
jgi:deoxyadenosine/deoxycytidine kinase